jgi:hypothetical protein
MLEENNKVMVSMLASLTAPTAYRSHFDLCRETTAVSTNSPSVWKSISLLQALLSDNWRFEVVAAIPLCIPRSFQAFIPQTPVPFGIP